MTKEEAIEILKTDSCVDCGVGSQSPCTCTFDGHCDIKDAMEMAIKALEQQPSEDCVDRNHVIATISHHHFDKDKDNFDLLVHNLCKEVKELPPVTPTIPTSEDCVSRQATLDAIIKELCIKDESYLLQSEKAIYNVVKNMPPVAPTQSWIPIITREPTEEEKEDYFEQNGEELCYMIDSPMPDNGQEVLVSVGDTVGEDVFDKDFWNFEGWDIEDVEAWMPMPKPYKE